MKPVKLFATVSVLVAFVLLSGNAAAQIQSYGIDADIDSDGKSSIKLTVTFTQPETPFRFDVIGRIQNFNATSNAGSIDCKLDVSGVSSIECEMALTEEKRTIEMTFETNDFVKLLDNKFYFDADFGLNRDIERAFAFVRLPEGMALSSRQPSPENSTAISDGRRIIITWLLTGLKSDTPMRYEILYERIQQPVGFQVRLRYIIVIGIVAAAVTSYAYLRYFRKPEQLVLSVLDDYERKIMDMLVASDGVVNQKKIVQDTNLSKAKISRVVKSLVNRGLVEVERTGRTNKLKLVKKKFKI
ncbi:hypothetical protein A3K63_04090 [Candidatus Micrarchaeota archaeon RBG_16_49_10]|nr:MAG: hypothetical protein A3K63_04090 [Candidatus Micrarchaeota archaeon RBG_16_49_10]